MRVINIRAESNRNAGIFLLGTGHLVKDSTANNNGTDNKCCNDGIYVGTGSTVTGNITNGNSRDGIFANDGSTVTGNTAFNNAANGISVNGVGVTAIGNTATNNVVGISCESGCLITGNNVSDNTNGINVGGDHNLITGNTSTSNSGDGLRLGGNADWNVVEENLFAGNDNGIVLNANTDDVADNYCNNNRFANNATTNLLDIGGGSNPSCIADTAF